MGQTFGANKQDTTVGVKTVAAPESGRAETASGNCKLRTRNIQY